MMHISTQQNPTYFDEKRSANIMSARGRSSSLRRTRMTEDHRPRNIIRGRLETGDDEETDVFLMNDVDIYPVNGTIPKISASRKSSDQGDDITSLSSQSSLSPKKKHSDSGIGLGKKFTQLFWKSKPKSSVGSDNSSTSGLASPTLTTPDSCSSVYTNSLDGDSQFSSHSASVHSAPTSSNFFRANLSIEDQFCTYSYDDCQRYATNMYYNVGEGSSFFCRADTGLRARNNSVPITARAAKMKLDPRIGIDDGTPTCYYNTNFSTFPNPRRHSIAASASSTSSSKVDDCDEATRDGYLVPIKTQKQTFGLRNKINLYINENVTPGSGESIPVNVRADIHTPTSPDAVDFGFSQNCGQHQNDSGHGSQNRQELYQPSSNDSSSTMVDVAGSFQEKEESARDKMLGIHSNSSRIPQTGSACEPYCSLCASSVQTPTNPFSPSSKSRMDVAIVSCHECFFSQRAEGQLNGFFVKIVGSDGQKLDVRLKSYDLKEIDQTEVAAEFHRSKVQIVIISNHFLDRLKHEATKRKKISPLNRVLRPNRTIAVLVSLSSKDVIGGYQNVLARFREWHSIELRATSKLDPEFCKAFTTQVTKIYNMEVSNLSNFSVFPKKVTKEQPKIAIMLKKPIELGDSLRIELRRGRQVELIDDIMTTNPYAAMVRIPELLCAERTALIEVSVLINNKKLGAKLIKCEYQAKQVEEDTIERMIQALPGFRKMLDEHLSQRLLLDFRSNQDFSLDPTLELMNDALICKGESFPTMMHFAAYYGLQQTVWVLLEDGDGLESCSVSNDAGDIPLTIANTRGFENIGQTIKDYQEVTVSWKAFQYMKDLYEQHSEGTEGQLLGETESELSPEKTVYSNLDFEESQDLEPVRQDGVEMIPELTAQVELNSFVFPEVIESEDTIINQRHLNPSEDQQLSPKLPLADETKLFAANPALESYDIPPPPVFLFETKGISSTVSSTVAVDSSTVIYYDTPRPSQEDYCIPPTDPKPVLPEKRMIVHQKAVFTKKTNTIQSDPDGYICVDPQHHLNDSDSSSDPEISTADSGVTPAPKESPTYPDINPKQEEIQKNQAKSSSPAGTPKQVILDPTEEELVELMNGFKNNVYSMRELELLFENWKSRSDVQRGFEDKQKQLKTTRDHYKKIQENLRRNNKNSNPLDRLFKFIPGSRKKHSVTSLTIAPAPVSTTVLVQRDDPIRKISSDSAGAASVHCTSPAPDTSQSESDSEKGQGAGPVFWKNPLDRRFVTSYVAPTHNQLSSLPASKSEDNLQQEIVDVPPPRPFKKPSVISDSPIGAASPPATPFLGKRPPPVPPASHKHNPNGKTHSKLLKKISKGNHFQPPAPPPPPRSALAKVERGAVLNPETWN